MELSKPLVQLGYGLIAFSLVMFSFLFLVEDYNDGLGVFIFNYLVASVYFIIFLVRRKELKKEGKHKEFVSYVYPVSLVLFSISAHSLNYGTEINVYSPYVNWMSVLVVLMHVAILAFPYRNRIPVWLQYPLYVLGALGSVVSLYLTIFIGPLLLYSIPGAIFFGISLHSYVPLLVLIYFIKTIVKTENNPVASKAYIAGWVICFVVLGSFLYKWKGIQNQIEHTQMAYKQEPEHGLPEWVMLSQHLPDDPLTESVIMSNSFTQKWFWTDSGFNGFGRRMDIRIMHNPLAVIARSLFGPLEFDFNTLKHILEAKYDLRHQTHRRLWRGDNLSTSSVKTEIEAYPDFRLAYVEKTLDIHYNTHRNSWWRPQQEAVYTFYLPEGSVATSLSLWINGVEEKSRLTTKGKADSAYVEIVGVERRDPALLHWQEGNRVTVTVFPCTPDEDRTFKIGFTMPLAYEAGRLHLDNVYFDGPEVSETQEEVHVRFVGSTPKDLSLPPSLKKISEKEYKLEASYAPNWQMSWEAPEISSKPFTYENQRYTLRTLDKQTQAWEADEIILDITAAWKPWELAGIWDLVKDKEVYVFNPKKTKLDEKNHEALIKDLAEKKFSFLPLHLLNNWKKTLIISHGTENAPQLTDLEGSIYSQDLRYFLFNSTQPLKWYNLGSEVSPYVQSLESFGLLDFALGNMDELEKMMQEKKYPMVDENEQQIALHQSDILIQKEYLEEVEVETVGKNQAPDHVMRLFRYNELLHHIGKAYFDREALEETWIRKAEEAYVVSPVSSLIVLETQKDYERMGIEENRDTLGNAKMQNSGAVPEPHEWVLIFLVLGVILWQVKGRYF